MRTGGHVIRQETFLGSLLHNFGKNQVKETGSRVSDFLNEREMGCCV